MIRKETDGFNGYAAVISGNAKIHALFDPEHFTYFFRNREYTLRLHFDDVFHGMSLHRNFCISDFL